MKTASEERVFRAVNYLVSFAGAVVLVVLSLRPSSLLDRTMEALRLGDLERFNPDCAN